jgi:hypothetical protein
MRKVEGLAIGLTLAMLAGNVDAARRQDVIDCSTGAYQNTETLNIPDGQREPISEMPDSVVLFSRQGGGVIVESKHDIRDVPTLLALGREYHRKGKDTGFYVPSNTVVDQGYRKDHEITIKGRTEDNTGSVVEVKATCLNNAPRK